MPLGVLVNSVGIVLGGVLGGWAGKRLPERIGAMLPNVFGLCAVSIGISLMVQVSSLTVVVLAGILGAIAGELLGVETCISRCLHRLFQKNRNEAGDEQAAFLSAMINMIVLFGFSGTGVFGALNSGFTGDHTILFAKTVLDFFTAIVFGAALGYAICATAVPQAVVGLLLFFSSSALLPLLTGPMIQDFKACGGIITFAVGLKMMQVKQFAILNLVPALLLVMPLSYLWSLIPF